MQEIAEIKSELRSLTLLLDGIKKRLSTCKPEILQGMSEEGLRQIIDAFAPDGSFREQREQ